ncbi:MAG: radical SAM protein [Thermodesulfobacteriota bacterium]
MDLAGLLESDASLAAEAGRLRLDPDYSFPLLSAKLKLTWRCNLRCRVCSLWRLGLSQTAGNEPLTPGRVAGVLKYLKRRGLRKVHFSGGEVLLRPDLEEIVRTAADLDLQVNLTTNGTLLDRDQARMLVEARVHTVALSMDGASGRQHDEMRGVKGAWRLTWKGLERLRERKEQKGHGPVIAVNTIVTRKNIERLSELYRLLEDRGVETWRLLPVRTPDKKLRPTSRQWARAAQVWEEWKPLLTRGLTGWRSPLEAVKAAKGRYAGRAFADSFCYAPWFNVFIDADGSVSPCCTGRWKMPKYGSLLSSSLDQVLASETRREICSSLASGHLYEICRSCEEFREENEAFARTAEKEVSG